MDYIFGIDIGGTTVKLGCFSADGHLITKWEIPTNTANGGISILPDVARSIQTYISKEKLPHARILGAGMGVPGPVEKDGTVNKCINLGWGVLNASETLSELLQLPVRTGNDATIATLGEMWKGGGEGYQNVVMLTLGTGVGGGVVIDGDIVYGTTGAAGEVGHMCVNPDETDACNCGNHGCLEQYASATGIVRMCRKQLQFCDTSTPLRQIENVTAKDIFDFAKANDTFAKALVDRYNHYLGLACSYIAAVVNPEVFVIGGGVSRAGSIILDGTEAAYQKYVFHACRNAKFRLAKLGNDAGIYGAARLML